MPFCPGPLMYFCSGVDVQCQNEYPWQKLLYLSRDIARDHENSRRSCFSALHSDRLPNGRHYAKQRFVAQFFRVARAASGLALPLSPNGLALCISTTPARAADDHAGDRGCSGPGHAGRRQSLSTGDRRIAGNGDPLGAATGIFAIAAIKLGNFLIFLTPVNSLSPARFRESDNCVPTRTLLKAFCPDLS